MCCGWVRGRPVSVCRLRACRGDFTSLFPNAKIQSIFDVAKYFAVFFHFPSFFSSFWLLRVPFCYPFQYTATQRTSCKNEKIINPVPLCPKDCDLNRLTMIDDKIDVKIDVPIKAIKSSIDVNLIINRQKSNLSGTYNVIRCRQHRGFGADAPRDDAGCAAA